MNLVKVKSINGNYEMYIENVPTLSNEIIQFCSVMGYNLKLVKDSGISKCWFGSKSVKPYEVGNKTDNYNHLIITLKSMLDNLQTNVWLENELCYGNTFTQIEEFVPQTNHLVKKYNQFKQLNK